MKVLLYEIDSESGELLRQALHRAFGTVESINVHRRGPLNMPAWLSGVKAVFADVGGNENPGIEFLKAVEAYDPRIPCIALAEHPDFKCAQASLRAGAWNFLARPLSLSDVNQALEKLKRYIDDKEAVYEKNTKVERAVLERSEFLFSVLESGFISSVLLREEDDSEWSRYKRILGIEENYGYILAIECTGRQAQSRTWAAEQGKEHFKFCRIIRRYFSNAIIGTPISRRLFLCIPVRGEQGEYSGQIQSMDHVGRMAEEIEMKTGHSVKIGIGNIQVMERLRISYKEAVFALKQSLKKVMHIDMMYAFPAGDDGYPFETEEEIFLAVRQGSALIVREHSERFFEWMAQREGGLNDSMRLKCLEFVLRAENIGYFEGGGARCFENGKEYLDDVFALNTVEEMKKWFLEKMEDAGVNMGRPAKETYGGLVGQAQRYVEEHFGQEISLNKIAGELNVNASYLSRIFKEETGTGFVDYLMRTRVERAEKLLCATEKSIKEIGAECGYASQNYFSRVFRKITGTSPAEYRKKYSRAPYRNMDAYRRNKK